MNIKNIVVCLSIFLCSCQTTEGVAKTYKAKSSYYWQGNKTASGEKFNPHGLTTAHRSYPFGTRLRLTNPANNKSVIVRVNDRGPYVSGRDLDVSLGVAKTLGFVKNGTASLKVEVLSER